MTTNTTDISKKEAKALFRSFDERLANGCVPFSRIIQGHMPEAEPDHEPLTAEQLMHITSCPFCGDNDEVVRLRFADINR